MHSCQPIEHSDPITIELTKSTFNVLFHKKEGQCQESWKQEGELKIIALTEAFVGGRKSMSAGSLLTLHAPSTRNLTCKTINTS